MELSSIALGLSIRNKKTGIPYKFVQTIDGKDHIFTSQIDGRPLIFPTREALLKVWADGTFEFFNAENPINPTATKSKPKALRGLELYTETQQERALVRYRFVREAHRRGITRGQLQLLDQMIEEKWVEFKAPRRPHAGTACIWMKDYEDGGGDIQALIDGAPGRSSGSRLQIDVEQWIDEQVFAIYRRRPGGSLQDVKDQVHLQVIRANKLRHPTDQLHVPSYNTIRRRVLAMDHYEVCRERHGQVHADIKFRAVLHRIKAQRPLSRVEFDGTWTNMYVIDDELGIPLGRAHYIGVRCAATGYPLGMHVSFAHSSLLTNLAAMRHHIVPKFGLREKYPDIENEWHAYGVGENYVFDNPKETHSPDLISAVAEVGGDIEWNRVRTPYAKGGIESMMRESSRFYESKHGATYSNLIDRGDYDSKKDAVVRFSTLIFLLLKHHADYLALKPNKRKQERPIDAWLEGIEAYPPRLPGSADKLSVVIGRIKTAKVSHHGVEMLDLPYHSELLRDLIRRNGLGQTVRFKYDESDLEFIYVIDEKNRSYLPIPCILPDYARGLTMYQHKLIRRIRDVKLKLKGVESLLKAKEMLRQATLNELSRRPKGGFKHLARLSGMSSDSVFRGEPATIILPWQPPAADGAATIVPAIRRPKSEEVFNFTSRQIGVVP